MQERQIVSLREAAGEPGVLNVINQGARSNLTPSVTEMDLFGQAIGDAQTDFESCVQGEIVVAATFRGEMTDTKNTSITQARG